MANPTTKQPPEIDHTVDHENMAVPRSYSSINGWHDARSVLWNRSRDKPAPDTIIVAYTGVVREDEIWQDVLDIDPDNWHLLRVFFDYEEDEYVYKYLDGTLFNGKMQFFIVLAGVGANKILALK